jgi:solute carrier family 35 protein C2
LIVERPWTKFAASEGNFDEVARVVALGLVGGFFAICMVMCELYLILHTPAVILMIGGVIKEMTTILIE